MVVSTLVIVISAVVDISALGMALGIRKHVFFIRDLFPPFLTDLQPVKIQLNNSVCSAFTPLLDTYTLSAYVHHTNTHIQLHGNVIYGL